LTADPPPLPPPSPSPGGGQLAPAGSGALTPAGSSPRADRLARWAALALLLALALFGRRYHWVEEAGTAERDGYAGQAALLLAGSLPHDPYRPLFYPMAAAAITPLTGDAFTAARLLSNLAAAWLAWLAYAYGRRLGGAVVGGWAMALAAVNPNLWIIGQHATTDMLFAALAAAALLAGLRYLQAPAAAPALLAGLALGLAAFTRSNALFLLPALLAAWWLAPVWGPPVPPAPAPLPSRLGHLGLAAAAALVGLLPHWALRLVEFGSPFYDENWKNLAFKLYGYPDWSYLNRVPFHSAAEVALRDPVAVLRGGVAELWRFAGAGAAQLFGTWVHVLLVVAGALWLIVRRGRSGAAARPAAAGIPGELERRSAIWLVLSLLSFLAATAFAFFTWGRLLLVLLPGAYALGFASWAALQGAGSAPEAGSGVRAGAGAAARGGRAARWVMVAASAAGAALVLLLALKTFVYRLPAFVARHPYVEVEVLRRLDARLPPGAVLAGTSPFLGRYLVHRYVAIPDAFGAEVVAPALYYAQLARLVRDARVSYLVAGAVDLRARPPGLLAPNAPVPWLAPAGAERGVAVWRVVTGH
jgi:4-amino-4-deoxy-L-arabinose transferase-like glycosyltransferase